MSDTAQGPDWWQASDGKWYPRRDQPDFRPMPPPRRNPLTVVLIVLGVILGGFVLLGVIASVVVFAVSGTTDKNDLTGCRIDTRTIRTAEEAYAAKNGIYTASDEEENEAGLVDAGFLSKNSDLHYVGDVVGGVGTELAPGYKLRVQGKPGQADGTKTTCGVVGAEVGTVSTVSGKKVTNY